MRVKGATVQRFALGAALIAALAWNLAHAAEVRGVRVATGATGTRAEIALDAAAEYSLIRLHAPERLAVDLPAATLSPKLALPAGNGLVQRVRTGAPKPGTVRLVFDLAQPVAPLKPRLERGDGARLVIEWPGDSPIETASAGGASDPTPAQATQAARDATDRLVSQVLAGTSAPATPAGTAEAPPSASAVQAEASPKPTVVAGAPVSASTAGPAPVPRADTPAVAAATPAPIAKPAVVDRLQTAGITPATSAPSQPSAAPSAPMPAASAPPGSRIATGVPTRVATGKPAPAPARPMAGVARPLIVAIDAGHGGQDPGASGLNGSREKDVTLAIARELARQVNATPGLKAFLTRDTDVFLPLTRRTQLARQAHADIFVSIHADAAENRAAKGSSVYVLSLKGASSQRARWLADKENAADLIGGVRLAQASSTLASVLLDLTQSGQMRASEDAAGHVLGGLKRVGYNHKPNIERANFAVLRTSDMPAMLVETAFISNPEEEQRLNDPEHRRALAQAVLDGVNTYFTRQPPPGTLYAARAAADAAGGM